MERDAAAEAPPRPTDLLKGFGPGPFLKGLLADLEQDSTTAGVLSTHELHALLVLDAGGIRARPAQMVAVEVGQAVVAALDALDQLAAAKPARAA
jgi:hypothetical protein